uniref:Calx-beta domain-containing protein n=1 Tax=Heterorhabditis bacteriophora TaxID=37862 RepID=A0A1I7XKH1_HETBA
MTSVYEQIILQTRDRLFYRIKAIRWLTSSLRRTDMEREVEDTLNRASYDDGLTQSDGQVKPQIEFSARVYAIDPSDKSVTLTIIRRGSCHDAITVNYSTVNGVAKRDLHFLPKTETIKFLPSERKKNITIELVDGANWRPNNVFYVNLKIEDQEKNDKTSLGQCNVARVRYPDDSASLMGEPAVEFVKANYVAKENCGWVRVFVSRRGKKHSGETTVFYETLNITAQETFDYMPVKNGKLQFEGQEYEKYIDIEIIDDKQDEKDETFSIELLKTSDEEVSFARNRRTTVTIISDDNVLKNITNVRKLMGYYMRAMTPGQTTWLEQIRSAVSVNAGDTNNASLSDCIIHGIAFPWKFVFAFVPPPSLLGGWPCFIVALISIGVITAVVG